LTIWEQLRSRSFFDFLLCGTLIASATRLAAAGAEVTLLGLLVALLVTAEYLLARPSRLVGVGALIGAAGVSILTASQHDLAILLIYGTVFIVSSSRAPKHAILLAEAFYAACALPQAALGLLSGSGIPWQSLAFDLLAINLASAMGIELIRGWQSTRASLRQNETALAQQLIYARDLQEALRQSRGLKDAIIALRSYERHDLVLEQLVAEACSLTGADGASVLLPDETDTALVVTASAPADGDGINRGLRIPRGGPGLFAAMAKDRLGVWISDISGDPLAERSRALMQRFAVRSLAMLPITVGGQVTGALAVVWRRETHEFSHAERELLLALAEQTGVALERAALRGELAERAEGAEALHRVAAEFAGRREVPKIAASCIESLRALYGADAGAFYLLDERGALSIVTAQSISPQAVERLHWLYAGSPYPERARRRLSVILPDEGAEPGISKALIEEGIGSLVAIRAVTGERTVGGLVLYHRQPRRYRPHEIQLLETFGGRLAGAIELADAYERIETTHLQREEFLAVVSHELRQPIATIGTVAEALANTPGLGPTERRVLEGLRRQARSLARLAEDVLDVARLESGQLSLSRTSFDLAALVEAVAREVTEPDRVRLAIGSEGAAGARSALIADGDPERIGQAINNLLSNALKYSVAPSPVWVETVGGVSQIEVRVKDSGVGIAPEELPLLFTKYARLQGARCADVDGTGLGLYLTRLIMEAQGGSVRATSPGLGLGATFSLVVPRGSAPYLGAQVRDEACLAPTDEIVQGGR
jgi:signal transduction histidine kinase